MSKTEKMTERVTVKMDANLKAKLMREAERCGGDMSAYIRSLIENRLSQAAGTCYNCIGRLEKALDADDVGYELHAFIISLHPFIKQTEKTIRIKTVFIAFAWECILRFYQYAIKSFI